MTDLPTPPEMRSMPEFMLEHGDMLWHAGHRWFYDCPYPRMVPAAITKDLANPDGEYMVAVDPQAAEAWNKARRAERMG